MSEQNPYQKLGVSEHASFEEIQEAKKRLCQQFSNDPKVVESIETAYDAVIMDRLKLRQEGKIPVPERIRFPERSPETQPRSFPNNVDKTPSWLSQLIDTPSKAEVLWPTGIYLSLSAITLGAQKPQISTTVQGQASAQTSFLALIMALGVCASIYFISRKEGRFGRALLISLIALIAGIVIGGALVNLPIANTGILNTQQAATVLTMFFFWLSSSFLR
jgi:hypothetical protein